MTHTFISIRKKIGFLFILGFILALPSVTHAYSITPSDNKGTIDVSLDTTGLTNITQVQWLVTGYPITSGDVTLTSAPWDLTGFDTTLYPEGATNIDAIVESDQGETDVNYMMYITNTPPPPDYGSISCDGARGVVNCDIDSFGILTGVTSVQWYAVGDPIIPSDVTKTSYPWGMSFDSTLYPEGWTNIDAKITSDQGVTWDNVMIDIYNGPTPPDYGSASCDGNTGVINCDIDSFGDLTGVTSVQWFPTGLPVIPSDVTKTSFPWGVTFDTTLYPNGATNVDVAITCDQGVIWDDAQIDIEN